MHNTHVQNTQNNVQHTCTKYTKQTMYNTHVQNTQNNVQHTCTNTQNKQCTTHMYKIHKTMHNTHVQNTQNDVQHTCTKYTKQTMHNTHVQNTHKTMYNTKINVHDECLEKNNLLSGTLKVKRLENQES